MLSFDQLSFWEKRDYLEGIDYCIVGAGIVGLTTAIFIKKYQPQAKVVIIEKGYLPTGASTKNAGFVCFGSPSELLSDIKGTNEESVKETIELRWRGFQLLQELIGTKGMNFQKLGAFELFPETDESIIKESVEQLDYLNKIIFEVTGQNDAFKKPQTSTLLSKFKGFNKFISCQLEGQIDTGLMMDSLYKKAIAHDIKILYGIGVNSINIQDLNTSYGKIEFSKCIVCSNAFSTNLFPELDLQPARAQVIISSEIPNLKIKGIYHFDRGYYYFRNVGNRILLGGGRNLAIEEETTDQFGNSSQITNHLIQLLKSQILPNKEFKVEHQWSGIMGIGRQKYPIVKFLNPNVLCAVRLGGMGIAMGSAIGQKTAKTIINA